MSLDKAMQNLKYDVRLTNYNLNNGIIGKDELKAHLDKLPDLSNNAEKIDLEEGKSSFDEAH